MKKLALTSGLSLLVLLAACDSEEVTEEVDATEPEATEEDDDDVDVEVTEEEAPEEEVEEEPETEASSDQLVTLGEGVNVQDEDYFDEIYAEYYAVVRNDNEEEVSIGANVTLYDESESMVGSFSHIQVTPQVIGPGENAYLTGFQEIDEDYADYDVTLSIGRTLTSNEVDLEVVEVSLTSSSAIGKVENNSEHSINYPTLILAFYNSDDELLGVEMTGIDNTLEPGQTNSFEYNLDFVIFDSAEIERVEAVSSGYYDM
ncbi:FxLYD domain-containing protein [Geomicrobium sp. JCM 19055]|uniref:FxLYD domain-containing protein n=1 Tax=Geomicrobium sp. JCM 19055 TaxID=1460649 RepID=UPI00045ED94C|nr:FxLYD domain-containing protein [Geomicrobium sp. JCM 19055]GAJ97385.1 hypothetical protein JCM19055_241 [Geomicrobium sp. JCM 19055]